MRDTMVLAGKLGVDTVVTMSGLPAGAGDKTLNWFVSTVSWPDFDGFSYMKEGVKYQWRPLLHGGRNLPHRQGKRCQAHRYRGVPGALVRNVSHLQQAVKLSARIPMYWV